MIVLHLWSPAGHDLAPVRPVRTGGSTLSPRDATMLLLPDAKSFPNVLRSRLCSARLDGLRRPTLRYPRYQWANSA